MLCCIITHQKTCTRIMVIGLNLTIKNKNKNNARKSQEEVKAELIKSLKGCCHTTHDEMVENVK